jgi:hypothetical protein
VLTMIIIKIINTGFEKAAFEFRVFTERTLHPTPNFKLEAFLAYECRNIRSLETVMHIPFVLCDDFTVLAQSL